MGLAKLLLKISVFSPIFFQMYLKLIDSQDDIL